MTVPRKPAYQGSLNRIEVLCLVDQDMAWLCRTIIGMTGAYPVPTEAGRHNRVVGLLVFRIRRRASLVLLLDPTARVWSG